MLGFVFFLYLVQLTAKHIIAWYKTTPS